MGTFVKLFVLLFGLLTNFLSWLASQVAFLVRHVSFLIFFSKFQARLTSLDMPSMDDSLTGGSFLRFAFINMLLDIVYRSKDPRVILDGLRVVCQDPDLNENSDQIKVIKAIQPHSTVKYKESIDIWICCVQLRRRDGVRQGI